MLIVAAHLPDDEHRHHGRRALAAGDEVAEHRRRLHGEALRPRRGRVVHLLHHLDGGACVFVMTMGYSRILYAAARNGDFFRVFGYVHPRGRFPLVLLAVRNLKLSKLHKHGHVLLIDRVTQT